MMKFKNIIAAFAFTLTFASCSFFEVEPQVICSETFYNTEDEVLYGLAGVYGVMSNEAFYGNYYSLMCSNVDDLSYYNRATTTNYTQTYTHDASSTEIYAAWTEIYKGIRNANAFMAAVVDSEFDEDGKYYNEARFLRAYYHFLLAQAWGDVPLKTKAATSVDDVMSPATSQNEVLSFVVKEMEECVALADSLVTNAPSRVTKSAVHGILARVYLFMAGESVTGMDKKDCYKKAMQHADAVIKSTYHSLNPSYSQVFINMISDQYDKQYNESIWEVDFMGNRQSSDMWSNGRIGDLIGLQSSASEDYTVFACNYSYGQYDGSLKLWDLYWIEDRTDGERKTHGKITDSRQAWNLPPYNYAGTTSEKYKWPLEKDETGVYVKEKLDIPASVEKTPYIYGGYSSLDTVTVAQGGRNCGKWRREVQYEGVLDSKRLYTGINFPILRYSDVLLMYAEASLEYAEAPSQDAYDCVKAVRDRAGVATRNFSDYNTDTFRQLVRNERGRELCFEATRKYDLIRWGIFVEEMNSYYKYTTDTRWAASPKSAYAAEIGKAVQPKHVLLPIPNVELGVNRQLKQNPLW